MAGLAIFQERLHFSLDQGQHPREFLLYFLIFANFVPPPSHILPSPLVEELSKDLSTSGILICWFLPIKSLCIKDKKCHLFKMMLVNGYILCLYPQLHLPEANIVFCRNIDGDEKRGGGKIGVIGNIWTRYGFCPSMRMYSQICIFFEQKHYS